MNTKGKMTPGPWRIGDAGHTVFGPPTGDPCPEVIASVRRRSDARAIQTLPELVEASKVLCEHYTTPNKIVDSLRRLLARIDGE